MQKVVQCNAVQYSAVQYSTVQYSGVHWSTLPYSAVQSITVKYIVTPQFHGRPASILYPSCFDANAGLFEQICGPEVHHELKKRTRLEHLLHLEHLEHPEHSEYLEHPDHHPAISVFRT